MSSRVLVVKVVCFVLVEDQLGRRVHLIGVTSKIDAVLTGLVLQDDERAFGL
jgi:hypothetical protein